MVTFSKKKKKKQRSHFGHLQPPNNFVKDNFPFLSLSQDKRSFKDFELSHSFKFFSERERERERSERERMAQRKYLVEVEKAKEAKDGRPAMGPVYRSLFAKDGFPAPIQGMDSCWDVFR